MIRSVEWMQCAGERSGDFFGLGFGGGEERGVVRRESWYKERVAR